MFVHNNTVRHARLYAGHQRLVSLALAIATLLASLTLGLALTFPPLTGRVVDEAGILDAGTRAALTQKLADLEGKSGIQLVVATLKSLQGTSIEDYGYQLGRAWGIGQKGQNNGVLLIVAPNERKVRIEVGYGLEGTLTDAITRLIIANSILPRFRANDFPGGITRGADDIVSVLSGDASEWKQRAAQRPENASPTIDVGTIILMIVIFIVVVRLISRSHRGQALRRGRRGAWGPVVVPAPSGGWGGGWSSGSGGSSDGGFSGGGGSFGGGGSSGDW